MLDYMVEAVRDSLDCAGCFDALTDEQVKKVAKQLEGWVENRGQAFGHDQISYPKTIEESIHKKIMADNEGSHRREVEDLKQQLKNAGYAYNRLLNTLQEERRARA